jgi:hypothetical protein
VPSAAEVRVTALNQGTVGSNSGSIRITSSLLGSSANFQTFNASTNEVITLRVNVAP